MSWNLIVFETRRGEKPVENFIRSLDKSTIAKVAHNIDLLEKHGSHLRMPRSKKLTTSLYELRIRGKQEVRIIYAFMDKNIYLLQAFKKKTRKIPRREIKTAEKRLTTLLK